MASASLRKCRFPSCNTLVRGPFCGQHAAHYQAIEKEQKEKRLKKLFDNKLKTEKTKNSSKPYNSRWQKARKVFLLDYPCCAEHLKQKEYVPATHVDHIVPHCGNNELFWNRNNWQSLCHSCHSKKTASKDGGFGNSKR